MQHQGVHYDTGTMFRGPGYAISTRRAALDHGPGDEANDRIDQPEPPRHLSPDERLEHRVAGRG